MSVFAVLFPVVCGGGVCPSCSSVCAACPVRCSAVRSTPSCCGSPTRAAGRCPAFCWPRPTPTCWRWNCSLRPRATGGSRCAVARTPLLGPLLGGDSPARPCHGGAAAGRRPAPGRLPPAPALAARAACRRRPAAGAAAVRRRRTRPAAAAATLGEGSGDSQRGGVGAAVPRRRLSAETAPRRPGERRPGGRGAHRAGAGGRGGGALATGQDCRRGRGRGAQRRDRLPRGVVERVAPSSAAEKADAANSAAVEGELLNIDALSLASGPALSDQHQQQQQQQHQHQEQETPGAGLSDWPCVQFLLRHKLKLPPLIPVPSTGPPGAAPERPSAESAALAAAVRVGATVLLQWRVSGRGGGQRMAEGWADCEWLGKTERTRRLNGRNWEGEV